MGKSMSLRRPSEPEFAHPAELAGREVEPVLLRAAWHSLAWLVVANVIGLLIATLLLWPGLNHWLGEWTYGRWMPLHLNLHLYGWCSLPLVAWLFHAYGTDRAPASRWARVALWAWSGALIVGAVSWLNGHSSGKLFLDWTGYARVFFPVAAVALWAVLAWSVFCHWTGFTLFRRVAVVAGLLALLPVPWLLYWSADPGVYPALDPGTGGPTGANLLGSTLGILLIMLLLPFGLGRRVVHFKWQVTVVWLLYGALIATFFSMDRGNTSHWQREQIFGLGCLVTWVPLLVAYYRSFDWPPQVSLWRNAFLVWWGLLVVTAWLVFLPGALDRLKFTNGLVAHSHMAMAGFVSSLNLFLLAMVLPRGGKLLGSRTSFVAWHAGTFGYVALMFVMGWREGARPEMTLIPGTERNFFYAARLGCGLMMTWASVNWLRAVARELKCGEAASVLPHPRSSPPDEASIKQTGTL